MSLSIIIPTFNEADGVGLLISFLRREGGTALAEVIVSDGGSTDDTVAVAEAAGAKVVRAPRKGRAAQMNAGATLAEGTVLYFLHADTYPPPGFAQAILRAVEKDCAAGCFRLRFDEPHWFLRAHGWFTRFDFNPFRFGDQSLFVHRDLFIKVHGFREELIVLEDQEIIGRLKKGGRFRVLNTSVLTSARKYREHGVYRTQGVFYLIYFMYVLGFSQQRMVHTYRRLIKQNKV